MIILKKYIQTFNLFLEQLGGKYEKTDFLKELDEIIIDSLFIGNSIDDLDKEISQNNWSISTGQELASDFTTNDLISFFIKVQNNRKEQIVNNCDHNIFLRLV